MNPSIQLKHFAFLTNERLHLAQETVNWSFNFVICIWFHFIRISQTSDLIWSDYPIHLISIDQNIPYIWFHFIRYPLHLVSFYRLFHTSDFIWSDIPCIWFHLIRISHTSGFIWSEYFLHLVSLNQNIPFIWFHLIRIFPTSGFIHQNIPFIWFHLIRLFHLFGLIWTE